MTTPERAAALRRNHFNKLAVIKEVGAIEFRLADTNLSPALRRLIISRHVANLIADLDQHQAKFGAILERLAAKHTTEDEILAGCALLRSLVPVTIGLTTAGSIVKLPDGSFAVKRKEHLERISGGIIEHLPPDTKVTVYEQV